MVLISLYSIPLVESFLSPLIALSVAGAGPLDTVFLVLPMT